MASPGYSDTGTVPDLTPDLEKVQQSFYQDAFQAFVGGIRTAAPQLPLGKGAIPCPAFDPSASRNDWITLFEKQVVTYQKLSPSDAKSLDTLIGNISYSYYQNQPYSHVPYLTALPFSGPLPAAPKILETEPLPLLQKFPTPHTLDVNAYVDERFSQPLQDFIRSHHVPLYGHDTDCDQAIDYHRSQGFTQVDQYMGNGDNPDPPYFLAYSPTTQRYRFGVCDLTGKDDVIRIGEILGPLFKDNGATMVMHANPDPLLEFNSTGQSLKIAPSDRVIIGYQNTVWWALHQSADGADWQRIMLTIGGNEADLFLNKRTGQKIISVSNVYGDEMQMALQTFYDKGARRFVYLGTSGGLAPNVRVGDVMIPTRFQLPDGSWISFSNDASKMNLHPAKSVQLIENSRQGWVSTLIEESVANMKKMRSQNVQAIDVESRYIAQFFQGHPAAEKSVVITISDLPLGDLTYDKAEAARNSDFDSLNNMLPTILAGPVAATSNSPASGCEPPATNGIEVQLPAVPALISGK
jgi:purine-nucleoside phosphorylase